MVEGKGGIKVQVIADSISPEDIRITTLHCTYPRFIHSQVMTHRMFSRNARSSRAVPVTRLIEEVKEHPATPIYMGENKRGMQSGKELDEREIVFCYEEWYEASKDACFHADYFDEVGLHKQIANRVLEPFLFIDTLITSTEWDNFFNLRLHEDAQPEIQELARCMKKAMDFNCPTQLDYEDWHLPYITETETGVSFNDLLLISAARCARISYKPFDGSSDPYKDLELARRLVASRHMSPFEHQARAIAPLHRKYIQGMTHIDRNNNAWSNNFRGWVQYRAILENENET